LLQRGIGPDWTIGERARLYLCVHHGPGDGEPVGAAGLLLEPGASLVIDAARPYGDLELEPGRVLRVDPGAASRISIGKDVVVRSGVRIAVSVGRGALLTIPDGRVFDEDAELSVEPGDKQTL